MPRPLRSAVLKHPQAVVWKQWLPALRPIQDFEWFDTDAARAEYFTDLVADFTDDVEGEVVIAEVVDTEIMSLGRVSWFPADSVRAERFAEAICAEPTALLAKRRRRAKANISWITPHLATGGDFAYLDDVMVEQLDDLLIQGVGLVIDCRAEADDSNLWQDVAASRDDAPTYLHLGTDDAEGWTIPPDHFDAAVTTTAAALAAGKRVFVHCHMGVNRGPSTAYAVLLSLGFGITEAFDAIRAARPVAGIAYAEDALAWWAMNQGWDANRTSAARRHLASHMDLVLGSKETRLIERAIRSMAESDRRQIEDGKL